MREVEGGKESKVHSELTAVGHFLFCTQQMPVPFGGEPNCESPAWLHLKRHKMHMAAHMTVGPLIENTVMPLQRHEKPFCSLRQVQAAVALSTPPNLRHFPSAILLQ